MATFGAMVDGLGWFVMWEEVRCENMLGLLSSNQIRGRRKKEERVRWQAGA